MRKPKIIPKSNWRRKDIHSQAEFHNQFGSELVSLSMIENALRDLAIAGPESNELYYALDRFYACCSHDATIAEAEYDMVDYGWEGKES